MKFLPFYCDMDNDIVWNNTIIKKKKINGCYKDIGLKKKNLKFFYKKIKKQLIF